MITLFPCHHTFFDSSDTNIVLRSVPIIILSFANSNCPADNFSAPSTAALIAATLTKFAKSVQNEGIHIRYTGGPIVHLNLLNQKKSAGQVGVGVVKGRSWAGGEGRVRSEEKVIPFPLTILTNTT